VLSDPEIGGFDIRTVIGQPAHVVAESVEEFFADRAPQDLLVVHFSGHGIKNQAGELHFAASNTKLARLARVDGDPSPVREPADERQPVPSHRPAA
jgi:uncharacterized caspase-like protein